MRVNLQIALLLTLGWMIVTVEGCAQSHNVEGGNKARQISANLQNIKLGMTKVEVEALLGKPAEIETWEHHSGTWLLTASEVWLYPSYEEVVIYFDVKGQVMFVYNKYARLQPPEEKP
jgi:outer membrane protein assembly factor BamE (lipoprotein component of BamABCDE complex)